MKQIRIEPLPRREETLSGAEMRRASGAGPEIVCTAAGCFTVWRDPFAFPAVTPAPYFPALVGGIAPFYPPPLTAPVITQPIVAIVHPRRRRHRW